MGSGWFDNGWLFDRKMAASALIGRRHVIFASSISVVFLLTAAVGFAQPGPPASRRPSGSGPPRRPWEDLMPWLDIYNPKYVRQSGAWSRDDATVTMEGPGRLGLPFEPQLRHKGEDPQASRYHLELEVERLGPGPLFLAFPVGQIDRFGVVTVALDFELGSGPCVVHGQAFSAHELWRKHARQLLPDKQRVLVRCDIVSLEGLAGELTVVVGDTEAYRGPIDAAHMAETVTSPHPGGVKFEPFRTLSIGGEGRFRFTRVATQGRGLFPVVRGPGEPLTPAPVPATRKAKANSPASQPPIADLTPGVWRITPLDDHIRFQWAKLHIVSSTKGDVRGVIQWIGPDKERAYEIVRGLIVGDSLTLHGIDHQRYLIDLRIARYRGKVSADGKRFHSVETIVDGRLIRDESATERFEAIWEGPNTAIGRGAQTAFDTLFRTQSDEDSICKQFTDYLFITEHEGRTIARAHQADRVALASLAQSSNPHVRAAALGMMQGELMRDAKNTGANISAAIEIAQASSQGLSSKLLELQANRDSVLARVPGSNPNSTETIAAIDRINSEYHEATSRLFNAAFNNQGIQKIYLNDIQRTKMSAEGFRLNQAINQQILAILRERKGPTDPLSSTWGQRIEGGYSTISVGLTNTTKQMLENCVFLTEFQVDKEKSKADREKQVFNERVVGRLAGLTMGLDRDATDIAEADSQAQYELLLCDTSCLIWLPQWRPGERVHIKLAKTRAATWGKSATLAVWTNQTGLKESKLSLVSIAAEAKRAQVIPKKTIPSRR